MRLRGKSRVLHHGAWVERQQPLKGAPEGKR
jgi:hypothetical protein